MNFSARLQTKDSGKRCRNLGLSSRIKEAFYEGYYDNAKQVAKLGAKLWTAPTKARPLQKSPRIPDFQAKTIEGKDFNLYKIIGASQMTLVGFFFNQFGEVGRCVSRQAHVKSFLDPFIAKYGSTDPRIGLVEAVKAPIMKMIAPYIRWKLEERRRSRYVVLHQNITEQRRSIGINNNVLGWINLVDGAGFVRWQAHGMATPEELQTLFILTDKYLTAKERRG
ncbi:hypothetical protein HDU91_007003 [Kappamyces sp. JEL0680]|nr:hypothetical protein HDU91_007003 [Kappamyces sp. JEL0680]